MTHTSLVCSINHFVIITNFGTLLDYMSKSIASDYRQNALSSEACNPALCGLGGGFGEREGSLCHHQSIFHEQFCSWKQMLHAAVQPAE